MSSAEELEKELKNLETQLSDPQIVLDYKKVAELSKRYAEIKRSLERGNDGESFEEAVIEIRAGTGGNEAALFAANLFSMYKKYASLKGWGTDLVDSSQNTLGGYKQVVFEVSGKNAYNSMCWESGVHRVQRVPDTEKSGRV